MKGIARQNMLRRIQSSLLVLAFTVAAVASATAQSGQSEKFSNIKIKNFGQMDARLYRGAQPMQEDYKALASIGVNTIIDLRNDPQDYAKAAAEAAGMKYVNIPMSDKKRPQDEQIEKFLNVVNDPATGVLYAHCAGGRHRTGVMGAVYRFNHDRWNYDQVYKEMKQYDYYSRWGHGALKEYVQDYYQRHQTKDIEATSGTTSSTSNQ
jgi:protein tyrosine/serine phosphatase